MSKGPKVWFITGTSKGFGHIWAQAALERGDQVAATARNTDILKDLVERYGEAVLPISLDVTDKAAVDGAVAQAHDHFGRLDVVVNNAGYGLFGTVEEVSEEQARAQLDTNLFGALWVTKAALPYLREQRSGHIIQVSSIGGVQAFPTLGLYHASKWALEGFSQSLSVEVHDFGIHVTLIEPTGYTTDWRGASSVQAEHLPAYDDLRAKLATLWNITDRGDPEATGAAILELVDADDPPLRVFFGRGPLEMIRAEYAQRIATWEQWNELSLLAHGNPPALPGVTVSEIPPVEENGEQWPGLQVHFPAEIATHSTVQEFYFGDDDLLRRHDYRVDVAGGFAAAQYVYDIVEADGIRMPTKRRAYRSDGEGRPIPDQLMVSIDLSDIRFD